MTNKQLELTRDIIMDKINEAQKTRKKANNFKELVQGIKDDHPATTIIANIEDIKDKIEELNKEKSQLLNDARQSLDLSGFDRFNRVKSKLQDVAEREAHQKLGLQKVTHKDIEKQIMLNRNKEVNDLIDAVTSALLNE